MTTITLKDLKIGSWIAYRRQICTVYRLEQHPTEPNIHEIGIETHSGELFIEPQHYVSGIPLSEKLLVNMGFTRNLTYRNDIIFDYKQTRMSIRNDQSNQLNWILSYKLVDIAIICAAHQLQNFIYGLCNEEPTFLNDN